MATLSDRTQDPAGNGFPPGLAPVTRLPTSPPGPDDDAFSLAAMLQTLAEGRWLILGTIVAALAVAQAYLTFTTPIYEADVLLQIEDRKQGSVATLADINAALAGPQSPAETQIEVLKSRSVLGSVVDDLELALSASPAYFPVIGRAVARVHRGPGLARPWLGLSSYAWGGERIEVGSLDLPRSLEASGATFTLVAGEGGAYTLLDAAGAPILTGVVGTTSTGRLPGVAPEEIVSIMVRQLVARPGTRFRIVESSRAAAIRSLQGALKIGEKARNTGVVRVAMAGPDPARITLILDTLAKNYLRQNVELRSAEAERTLAFLDTQVPLLRENLFKAENALESYRSAKGNIGLDLSLTTKATLDRVIELDKRVAELQMQRREALNRYTDGHPLVRGLNEKISYMQREQEALNREIQKLPEAESSSLRLMRDVKVANELYLTLLNKSQEMRIIKSGMTGNVHILDLAVRPDRPISPKRGETYLMALAVGVVGGLGLAMARKALHKGLVDPVEAERALGISVRAAVPHSVRQGKLQKEARASRTKQWPVLAAVDPSDMAVESLRALRTSLQFTLSESANRVVAIGGPRPGVGKSFVAANLARVFADAGSRILVVDADLRKGALHHYFGAERTPGLSELITGTATVEQVLHRGLVDGVDFVARGAAPPNPSELLASDRFRSVFDNLAEGADRYDLVLVDLPPILAVTDAALVGRLAGVNLMVLRAGWHPVGEVQVAVKTYLENGVRLSGLVFNDVPVGDGKYGGYNYQYRYHYQYSYK